jgi:WD40 repeat protein
MIQPAQKCGYRLEDDELVEKMLAEVEGERGALPLLAFALARLWENRDREAGLLTRQAYHDVGGVGGALAQHAESTIDHIGADRIAHVRELFRNLVTAEGTRAIREWDELLSVFSDSRSESPEEVLRALIDARLLTSYEIREEDEEPTRRVEIIHESLLANWPRLVRWQTQDADAAQLRDQLRQAAKTWDDRGRTDDTLWTGAAYREFASWRERYPGGLTQIEETFAAAMTSLATRRRRRRRIAAASVVVFLAAVAMVLGALWRRSVEETRRAEAGKLLALAQARLEEDTTAALAYTRASLALADTPEARRFAVEVLWRGPVARILPFERMAGELDLPKDSSPLESIALSPDGRWLATRSASNRRVLLFPRDGGPARALSRQPDGSARLLEFGPGGDLLITGGSGESLRIWSVPELEEIRSAELGGLRSLGRVRGGKLLTFTRTHEEGRELLVRAWTLPGGDPTVLGTFSRGWFGTDYGPSGTKMAHGRGRAVVISALEPPDLSKGRIVGEVGEGVRAVAFSPGGDLLAALDLSGEIRVWSTEGDGADPLHVFKGPRYNFFDTQFDPSGRFLTQITPNLSTIIWDLGSPPDFEPRAVGRKVTASHFMLAFDPGSAWLATSYGIDTIEFWPLGLPWVRTFREISSSLWSMDFTSDSRWLATCFLNEPARLWPLNAVDGSPRDLVPEARSMSVATHPTRGEVLVGTTRGEVLLYSTSDQPTQRLPGGWGEGMAIAAPIAFDPQGRRALASPYNAGRGFPDPKQRVLRIWDLESGEEQVYSIAHLTDADFDGAYFIGFAHDGSLYAPLEGGVLRLTLPAEPGGEISSETFSAESATSRLSRDGKYLLVQASDSTGTHMFRRERLQIFDLVNHTSRRITTHGNRMMPGARLDSTNRILVTGDIDGVVRAGPATGEEPHLLLGHEGMIMGLAISPDGRWIASSTEESLRLWPMPDVTKPALHTLPHAELMARLDDLTNLRAAPDPESATGWSLEVGPFPGWETVPTW